MKKLLIVAAVAAVAVVAATSAQAADIEARTYTKAPIMAPVSSWTGFYIGATAGARFGDVNWNSSIANGGPPFAPTNNRDMGSTGERFGGMLGYNWQVSPSWVLGVEADGAWGNNGKTSFVFPGINPAFGGATDIIRTKLDWDASVRARAGYLVTPSILVYATGGLAWQSIENTAICSADNATSFCGFGFANATFTEKSTKAGWTIGGGVETKIWASWTARAEYRYADFGTSTFVVPPLPGSGFTANIAVKTHTALVGIAYQFGR